MLSHIEGWRFGIFWQGDGSGGDGGSSGGDGGSSGDASGVGGSGGTSATDSGGGGDASATGGDTGFGSSVTAGQDASANTGYGDVTGMSVAGVNAPAAAVNAATNAATAFGSGQGGIGIGGTGAAGPAGSTATAPGAATGGSTGGGGGTAAGGSAPGNSGLANVLNHILSGGVGGAEIGVPAGLQNAYPASPVTVSNLAAPTTSPGLGFPSVVATLQSELAALAGQQASQSFGTSLGGQPPGGKGNMGFPSAGLAVSPRGGYTSSLNAPVGSTIGQSTVTGNPADMPSVHAQNVAPGAPPGTKSAALGSDAATGGLASAAQTAVNQTNPSVLAQTPATNQNTPGGAAGGQLMQLILQFLQGNPALAQLAQSALG